MKAIVTLAVVLAWLMILLAAAVGWVMNIWAIFTMSWETITGELIIRLVGVPVALIGAVAGYF